MNKTLLLFQNTNTYFMSLLSDRYSNNYSNQFHYKPSFAHFCFFRLDFFSFVSLLNSLDDMDIVH